MPMMAMVRNLGNMAEKGLFDRDHAHNLNTDRNVKLVTDALNNEQRLIQSRIHPLQVYT